MCLNEGSNDERPCATAATALAPVQTYYDNRYWTMWKLPMFGCSDPSQVIKEVRACVKAFPDCYIRLVAFDSISQCQTASFLVHRPASDDGYTEPQVRPLHHPRLAATSCALFLLRCVLACARNRLPQHNLPCLAVGGGGFHPCCAAETMWRGFAAAIVHMKR